MGLGFKIWDLGFKIWDLGWAQKAIVRGLPKIWCLLGGMPGLLPMERPGNHFVGLPSKDYSAVGSILGLPCLDLWESTIHHMSNVGGLNELPIQ